MSEKVEALKDEGTRRQVLLAGGIAGLVSRFCIAPLDVLKIRLQLQSHPSHSPVSPRPRLNTLATLLQILRQEGVRALWKGNIPAEALYVAYGSIQFSVYRSVSQLIHTLPSSTSPHIPETATSFIAGATAGGIATTATYPLDLLRTRFAAQGTERVYTSLLASVRDISTHEGPRGFFLGISAAISQIVPYMGLFFASYETLKPFLTSTTIIPIPTPDALAGTLASILSKTAVFPLDTVRKRLQVQGPTRARYAHGEMEVYSGVGETVRRVVRREGVRGLYRGLGVSLVKAAPASAVTMWTYERVLGGFGAWERGG